MEEPRNIGAMLFEIQNAFNAYQLPLDDLPSLQRLLDKGWSDDFNAHAACQRLKPYFTEKDMMFQLLIKLFLLRKMFTLYKQERHLFEQGISWFDLMQKTLVQKFNALVKNSQPPYTYFDNPINSLNDLENHAHIQQNSRRPLGVNTVGSIIMVSVVLSSITRNLRGTVDDSIRFPILWALSLIIVASLAEATYGYMTNTHYLEEARLSQNRFIMQSLLIADDEIYKLQTMPGKASVARNRLEEMDIRKRLDKWEFFNQCKLIVERGWDESLDAKITLTQLKPTEDKMAHFLLRVCLLKLMTEVYLEKKASGAKIEMDGKWLVDQKTALLEELRKKPLMTQYNRFIGAVEMSPVGSLISLLERNSRSGSAIMYASCVLLLIYGYGTMFGYVTPVTVRARNYFHPSAEQIELNRWQDLLRFSKTPEFQETFLPSAEQLTRACPRAFLSAQELVARRQPRGNQ